MHTMEFSEDHGPAVIRRQEKMAWSSEEPAPQCRYAAPEKGCLFCESDEVGFWQIKSTKSGCYGVWKCRVCCSGFVWPRPTDEQLECHYASSAYGCLGLDQANLIDTAYHPTSWGDAKLIIGRCSELAAGPDFLDVGAGNGTFSHVAKTYGFHVEAIEPNRNACTVFHELNGFRAHEEFFSLGFAERVKRSYDVVLLSQVLEHLPHPVETVKFLRLVLRQGGIAAIAVPHFGSLLSRLQGASDMFVSPPEHLNFFSRDGLTRLFRSNGFRLRFVETVSKVPRRKVERLARIRPLGALAWRVAFAGMRLSDWCGAGMVLNAYFEKVADRD
jgi:SAM-dependent methyltransferase